MMENNERRMDRRLVLAGATILLGGLASVGACSARGRAMRVYRDAGCGCCAAWVERARASGFEPSLENAPDMAALKQRYGVPADLASCHTALLDAYVIEGHVPGEDLLRLMRERPSGVRGLAVAGMPLGAPGMESPDGRRDAFAVIAFGENGRSVFARYSLA